MIITVHLLPHSLLFCVSSGFYLNVNYFPNIINRLVIEWDTNSVHCEAGNRSLCMKYINVSFQILKLRWKADSYLHSHRWQNLKSHKSGKVCPNGTRPFHTSSMSFCHYVCNTSYTYLENGSQFKFRYSLHIGKFQLMI